MRAMRIAVVSPFDYPCGIGQYTENVVREWRKAGHDVWGLADHVPESHLRGEFPADNVLRCWRRGECYSGVPVAVRALRPDIVNIQHDLSFCSDAEEWDTLLQQVQAVCPVVVTYHSWPRKPDGVTRNRRPDAVIVTNPKAFESAVQEGWPQERARFVPHATVRPLSAPLGEMNHSIVTWGFLSGSKGYGEALEALKLLLPEFPDASLTLHGALLPARAEGQLRCLSAQLAPGIWQGALGTKVAVHLGWPAEAELQALIARHSVCWLPYHHADETWCSSGCVQTAWSACRPLLTSRSAHFDVTPDFEPLLCRTDDVSEVAARTAQLWRDREEYDSLCARIRKHAESRGQAELAEDYVQVFRDVVPRSEARTSGGE